MTDVGMLERYVPVAEKIAEIVRFMMVSEFKLMPPSEYDLAREKDRVYLIGHFDPLKLVKKLTAYESDDVLRRLSNALNGLKIVCTRETGLHYVFILSGRLSLPNSVDFPGFGAKDIFRFGWGVQGEVRLPADQMRNVIIGASQGAGKSNTISLITHQARAFGWKLYLFDPQSHTFSPDVWNKIAAAPVGGSPEDFKALMERIEGEMAERVALFRKVANGGIPPADLDAYNKISDEPLARIIFVADEVNTVLGHSDIVSRLAELLRLGRKWGVYVALAGHNWRSKDVPRELSAMLQTRIALPVADDTSGTVVLGNSKWGKWVMGKRPGRGVLKNAKYTPLQFYRVTAEQESEWLATVETVSPLTHDERAMIDYSVTQLDGTFPFRKVAAGAGVGESYARRTAESWEQRGWLSPSENTQSGRLPRRISDELRKLAGFERTGALGTLALTGVALGALAVALATLGGI